MGSSFLIPGGSGSEESSVLSDLQASRPEASNSGKLFLPQNGYLPAYDGGAWNPLLPGFQCSKPGAAATFSKLNGGASSTLVDHGDGLLMSEGGYNSTSERACIWIKALPQTSNYIWTVGFIIDHILPLSTQRLGLTLNYGSGPGRNISFMLISTSGDRALDLVCYRYNDSFSYHSAYTINQAGIILSPEHLLFLRITDNGTNRIYSYSLDGIVWIDAVTVSRTDWTEPAYFGLRTAQGGTAINTTRMAVRAKVIHWGFEV